MNWGPQLPAFPPKTAAARTIAPGPIRLRTSFIDVQGAALNVLAVEGGNRFDGFSVVTHVNEPEPFGLSRFTVGHNADSLNFPAGFKKRTENRFCDGNAQVANKYAFHTLILTSLT
jgi:hypothetical protein